MKTTHGPMTGFTPEQRALTLAWYERLGIGPFRRGHNRSGTKEFPDHAGSGWFVHREPTTINPPRVIRLVKRDHDGAVLRTISVMERQPACPR